MNVNSQPQTLAIKNWLTDASAQLSKAGIPSYKLDAEIIIAKVLNKNRTYLHAHIDDILDIDAMKLANKLLISRISRVPIAYITGFKEFYGRDFSVDPSTLIPRPESEDIITILKQLTLASQHLSSIKLIDIGTGSGCLGITIKLEFPIFDVTLSDISESALEVAKLNAKNLLADVSIIHSDLLRNYQSRPNVIVANLPYVDKTWDRSPETDHEPSLALFADDKGLSIIKKLIAQATEKLEHNGYLIIESDPEQHNQLTEYAKNKSFNMIAHRGYILVFQLETNNP